MKKLIFPLLLILFVACSADIIQIEYRSTTMMGRTVLTMTQDSVIVAFNGRSAPTRYARSTKDIECKDLLVSLENVILDDIASLKAPSENRFIDAAPHASFVITTKKSTFTSAAFDGGKPNAVLKPLMDAVEKVQENNKK